MRRAAAILFCCCAAVAAFFRYQIADGFTRLFSDSYDGMLELALLDHWDNVLRGFSPWSEPLFFFPNKGVLGYNDGYLLYGLIYSLFRAFAIDPLLSGELVNLAVRAIGFLSGYAAARRILELPMTLSLLAATLFTVSNGAYVAMDHAQMLSVGFAPLLALPLHRAFRALIEGDRRGLAIGGSLFLLGCAAWLMTAFYAAWFFLLLVLAFSIAWLALAPAAERRRMQVALPREAPVLALLAGLAVLVDLPFLSLYLPKAVETGMRSYHEVSTFLPTPLDLVNVGDSNLLWGRAYGAFRRFIGAPTPAWLTLASGLPPATLSLFLAAAVWLWRSREPDARLRRLRALMAATLATWALVLQIGTVSAYPLIYYLVPGAKAIRVVVRYQLLLAVPVIGLGCAFLASRFGKAPVVLLAAVSAVLVAEQFNHLAVRQIDRPAQLARLGAVPPPPAGCGAFYVARTAQEAQGLADAVYRHSVDAMLLAELNHLPTVNGVDSFAPPGYDLYRPGEPSYRDRVRLYAERNNVHALCGLDMRSNRWQLPDQTEGLQP